jgi:hypothetical protein
MYCYEALGWREEKREEDRQYYDMKYLVLSRPHNIPNKDRLQYLQVKMETKLNSISHTTAYKHSGSMAFGAILIILALCFFATGLAFIFGLKASFALGLGIAFLVSGFLCAVGVIYPYTAMRAKENERADEKINVALRLIENYVTEARALYSFEERSAE